MKIYKRKDGRFSTQIKTPDGKYKTLYGKTKTEVREKYEQTLIDFKTKPFAEPNKIGLKDWFDKWFTTYTINLRPRTKDEYVKIFRNHIIPYFGNKSVQKITQKDCQEFVNDLATKIQPSTVKNYTNKLKRVMSDAVKEGIIAVSPAKDVLFPAIPERKVRTIEPSDMRRFLDKSAEMYPEYADVFEFLILTGLRISEFSGLTIDNYKQSEQSLTIEKQYQSLSSGKVFTPTKTGKSRTIILTKRAVEIVESRIERTEKLREDDPSYNEENFLFIKKNNYPYDRATIGRKLKSVCRACSMYEYRVHDLRHTYATLALALGSDVKTVQKNLGHSSAQITLDVYATSTNTMKKALNKKMDELWDSL